MIKISNKKTYGKSCGISYGGSYGISYGIKKTPFQKVFYVYKIYFLFLDFYILNIEITLFFIPYVSPYVSPCVSPYEIP